MATVAAVGDIIFGGRSLATPGSDESLPDGRTPLREADIAFANLEQPLTRDGSPADKRVVLRADPRATTILTTMGIDVVSCANNHMLDFGAMGLTETMAALDAVGIRHCGAGIDLARAMEPAVITVRGTKIAFLAFATTLPSGWRATNDEPGVAPVGVATAFLSDSELLAEQPGTPPQVVTTVDAVDKERLLRAVTLAKSENDVVMVSLHWGVPNGDSLATFQRPLAHALVDAGADVVLGHHAHALHAAELHQGKPIFYGLGHFIVQPQALGEHDWSSSHLPYSWLLTACARITLIGSDVAAADVFPFFLDLSGNPHRAYGRIAEAVIDRMCLLSRQFGTTIVPRDGCGRLATIVNE